ncbi:DUF4153 domain-containing protein [Qipengyuania sp. JC766]|uniref:DUF4153 domain-containing protein n=1 Tax=Qipengyuania sp. JC766 TaxID=3232139 RepID=UPI0034591F6B
MIDRSGDAAGETPIASSEAEDWPLRPAILAALGGVAGLVVWELLDGFDPGPVRSAFAAFIFFASGTLGFVLGPPIRIADLAFAAGVGAVMGGISGWAVAAGASYAGEEYAFAAGVFFALLAIPLYQSDFHRLRWHTPYCDTHFHVWTDAVCAGGAFLFVILSWILLWLLHGLFSLVGIDLIDEMIREGWFVGLFCGATFGGALGVLRNQIGVIGTLQRVVMLVFSLLTVPFALAVVIFVAILLLSGGNALWEATDSATPVLLACAVGCFVLANSVVRDDDASRSGNVVMQAAALALAVMILPLTIFAAISMGIRIDQYGLAPERIWALVAIAIAFAYGVAYWAALVRGRLTGWGAHIRRANLHLAVVTCAIAFVLAMPLLDFGAISTRDQLARLQSGEVSPEEFDFAALRWDFGDAGRDGLAALVASKDEAIRVEAGEALAQESRPDRWSDEFWVSDMTDQIIVYPSGAQMPDALAEAIKSEPVCRGDLVCRIYLQPDGRTAAVLGDRCVPPRVSRDDAIEPKYDCSIDAEPFVLIDGSWVAIQSIPTEPEMSAEEERESLRLEREAIERGDVRIAPAQERSIFIGDKQVGPIFD